MHLRIIHLLLALSLSPALLSAQVGIGVPNPQHGLEVRSNVPATIVIHPYGAAPGNTGELHFLERSGPDAVGIKAPDNLNGGYVLTLPGQLGNPGDNIVLGQGGQLDFQAGGGSGMGAGAAALGTDMFTQYIHQELNLWTPHTDNCDVNTEVFVQVANGKGFCMEKDERPPTSIDGAIKICLDQGKRLPEPLEWKFSCVTKGTFFLNLTNNDEWSSNFAQMVVVDGVVRGAAYSTAGNGSCNHSSHGRLGTDFGFQSIHAFRCVR